jgi:hypothetical protein
MLAIVCVVHMGSRTRTSAWSTARSTFSCALAGVAAIAVAAKAVAARAMLPLDRSARVHRLMAILLD